MSGADQSVVNLYEAKTRLSELVDRAARGEEVLIAKHGTPRARLVPLIEAREPRRPGGWGGRVWLSDDFDDPVPQAIARFFGSGDRP